MKTAILTCYLIIACSFAQPKQSEFSVFLEYVSSHGQLTEITKNNCQLQYALIKVNCNKNNRIINHQFLNKVSDDIKEYFYFIDGYQFKKNIPINSHSIIFCMTFENHNTDCILKNKNVPTDILKEVYGELGKQIKIDRKSIVLYDIPSAIYNEDTIK